MRISKRAGRIGPFYVMEVAKAASQLAHEVAHGDKPMVYLTIARRRHRNCRPRYG